MAGILDFTEFLSPKFSESGQRHCFPVRNADHGSLTFVECVMDFKIIESAGANKKIRDNVLWV